MIKFTDAEANWRGNDVIIAYKETAAGNEVVGKHYVHSGLSWNYPTQIRYHATMEEWKKNAREEKAIY